MLSGVHIVVAVSSDVIRRGVCSILAGAEQAVVESTEVMLAEGLFAEGLRDAVERLSPDVVIADPSFAAFVPPSAIRKMAPGVRCVMLQMLPGDAATAHLWDDVVSMWDSAAAIRERVLRPVLEPGPELRREQLSQREKAIIAMVVNGLTNKQIAEEMHLSHHTVATHRRNISTKLGIHSTAGLTVYAIRGKLINLEELDGAE